MCLWLCRGWGQCRGLVSTPCPFITSCSNFVLLAKGDACQFEKSGVQKNSGVPGLAPACGTKKHWCGFNQAWKSGMEVIRELWC